MLFAVSKERMTMIKSRMFPGYFLMLMLAALAFAPGLQARQKLPGFTDLIKECSPAVVNISTTQKAKSSMPQLPEGLEVPDLPEGSPLGELFKYFFDQEQGNHGYHDVMSLGSGFIISPDGYILTNYHVVNNADEIIVRLNDRREMPAKVIGSDKRSDVALVKIDAKDLPVVKIGSSARLEVGEWVLAIGSPFGFDYSATAGIVSAKGRSLPSENYVPFIQTDVAINPGNSGGPLFNQDGEVVGMNSQIYSRTGGYMGLSFAIPIEVAMDVADQLKTTGHVSRGWLGVLIQDISKDLAESFGMSQPHGALVAKVLPDSPAKAAGIRVGDVIVSFDGKEIEESASLPPIVGSTKVGKEIPVGILRNGKQIEIEVTLGELPEEGPAPTQAKPPVGKTSRLGLSVRDLSDDQKQELDVEGGVLVEQVAEGAAARAGISKGDVILSINNQPVRSASQFQKLVAALPAGKSVAVLVQRDGNPTFLAIRVPDAD
jgi:serine protease Do